MKKKNSTNLFFFFDRYAIGGAQRIHLDILESVKDIFKQVYFTRKSPNAKLKQEFYSIPNTSNSDIHIWCDYLVFRLFTVHYYSFYLNRHTGARVLSSNSTFFYDMLPFLNKGVIAIELLHNFSFGKNGMEFFGLANHQRLDYRIVYDSFTLSNIKKQYAEYSVAAPYLARILFIEPGVDLPEPTIKASGYPVKILYAGRGGPQKRVWLLNTIVENCIDKQLPVEFHFAGPMEDELSGIVKRMATIHGQVGSRDKMNALYRDSQIIILTSAYEGFPMVIKEGMSYGCVPLVTALEGNKMHLTDGSNAILIHAVENEEMVIKEGIRCIENIAGNMELLSKLSGNAYKYAREHFSRPLFMQKYRGFLLSGDIDGLHP